MPPFLIPALASMPCWIALITRDYLPEPIIVCDLSGGHKVLRTVADLNPAAAFLLPCSPQSI
jgi:hypothetical protein